MTYAGPVETSEHLLMNIGVMVFGIGYSIIHVIVTGGIGLTLLGVHLRHNCSMKLWNFLQVQHIAIRVHVQV